MEYWIKLDNHLFVAIFEKHLCQLKNFGFSSESIFFDKEDFQLELKYTGSFTLEITRDEHWSNPIIQLYPREFPPTLARKKINISEIVFLLSEGKEYIEPYFIGIRRYLPAYEPKIGRICQIIFEYYERISINFSPYHVFDFYKQIKENEKNFLKRTNEFTNNYDVNEDY